MRILPELEAYRARLMTKAAEWSDRSVEDLGRELDQCNRQTALIEKSLPELRRRMVEAPAGQTEPVENRLAVQEQMRELTLAYAEALRRHLEGRARG